MARRFGTYVNRDFYVHLHEHKKLQEENERLRALIDRALEWKPVFPLEASLIDEMWEAVGKKSRSILEGSTEHPTGDGA